MMDVKVDQKSFGLGRTMVKGGRGRLQVVLACCGAAGCPSLALGDEPSGWEKAKQESAELWEATKSTGDAAWEATRGTSANAWDATKRGSGDFWDATKEAGDRAWRASKDGSERTWSAARESGRETWRRFVNDAADPEPHSPPKYGDDTTR